MKWIALLALILLVGCVHEAHITGVGPIQSMTLSGWPDTAAKTDLTIDEQHEIPPLLRNGRARYRYSHMRWPWYVLEIAYIDGRTITYFFDAETGEGDVIGLSVHESAQLAALIQRIAARLTHDHESASAMAADKTNTAVLVLKEIAVREKALEISIIVTITNMSSAPIRYSGFRLENVLRNTKLFDEEGREWNIKENTMISDPPPPKREYGTLIAPAKSIVDTFTYDLKKPANFKDSRRPQYFNVKITGGLGVADERFERFWDIPFSAYGKVEVKWK